MGQVYVQTSQLTSVQTNQKTANPSPTLEILKVQAMEKKGKNKKQKENPNANLGVGDAPTMSNQPEGNQEKWKNKHPCNICQGDHPTHQFPHMYAFIAC